ncbi:hypothetical protein Tco_1163920 [Tanacetum coccineum]
MNDSGLKPAVPIIQSSSLPASYFCFVTAGVGCVHYYELDDNVYLVFLIDDDEEMDFFAFINHADPTKVQIGEKQIKGEKLPLLESTRGRVDEEVNVVADEKVVVAVADEVTIADKPKGTRKKKKTASGASDSILSPRRQREDHGTSSDAGASIARKSLLVLQDLFDSSTLAAEVSVTDAVTIPFVTSFVTPTPEREISGRTDSISWPNLWTHHLAKRFLISSDSSHHSSAKAVDDEVTSIVRSSVPSPVVLIAAVATTVIVGATSALVHEPGTGPVHRSIFRDSASPSTAEANVVGPSQPAEMDSETLQQTYVPKWNVINDSALDDIEFNVGVARQACFSAEVRLRSEHNYWERKKFERKCQTQIDLLKEKGAEIASLKERLSLKEAEAAKEICLRGQVATIESTETARVNELIGLKERYLALEEEKNVLEKKVAVLESTNATKETELTPLTTQTVKLTKDFSEFGLSCDELSVKASPLEAEKDRLPPEYLAALGKSIGRAIDKGIQNGLEEGIDHGMAERSLADVAAYDPFAEANYVSDVHAHVQRIKGEAASHHLSLSDDGVPLIKPLSARNLVGESSTSGVPAAVAVTSALSTNFTQTGSVPPILVSAHDTEPHVEVSSSAAIVFEKEELETMPERPKTS